MKKIQKAMITVCIELLLSLLIMLKFDFPFLDSAFYVGLGCTIFLFVVHSGGGFTTDILDSSIQGQTGVKMKRQDFIFQRSVSFVASLVFFICVLIPALIIYL